MRWYKNQTTEMSSLPSKPSQKNGLLFKLKAKLLACFGDTTAGHCSERIRKRKWWHTLSISQFCYFSSRVKPKGSKVKPLIDGFVKRQTNQGVKLGTFYEQLQNGLPLWSTSFTCVGRLWRSRHNTIKVILSQWHVNSTA